MTIDEAIRILTILESRSINNSTMFKKDALKLGIEALEQLRDWRKGGVIGLDEPLPNETE